MAEQGNALPIRARLHRTIHDRISEALGICEENDLHEHAAGIEQLAEIARQAERLVEGLRGIVEVPAGEGAS